MRVGSATSLAGECSVPRYGSCRDDPRSRQRKEHPELGITSILGGM